MAIDNMEELFITEIRHLYDVEHRLVKALPKMAEASDSDELRNAFQQHLEETQGHVTRLERIFSQFGQEADEKTSQPMKSMISEGEDLIGDTDESPLRDAGLIAAGNKVEHFEMASYGTARNFARLLGHEDAANLLDQTLQEESAADEKLTRIAESMVNQQALQYQST